MSFIEAHKGRFGVAPICRVLSGHRVTIAPSTFYEAKTRPPSRRSLRDDELKIEIGRVHGGLLIGAGHCITHVTSTGLAGTLCRLRSRVST